MNAAADGFYHSIGYSMAWAAQSPGLTSYLFIWEDE